MKGLAPGYSQETSRPASYLKQGLFLGSALHISVHTRPSHSALAPPTPPSLLSQYFSFSKGRKTLQVFPHTPSTLHQRKEPMGQVQARAESSEE